MSPELPKRQLAAAILKGRGPGRRRKKTLLCTHFMEGRCVLGDRCNFAHGMEELSFPVATTHTRFCCYMGDPNGCPLNGCPFPHSQTELFRRFQVFRATTQPPSDEDDDVSSADNRHLPIPAMCLSAAVVTAVAEPPQASPLLPCSVKDPYPSRGEGVLPEQLQECKTLLQRLDGSVSCGKASIVQLDCFDF